MEWKRLQEVKCPSCSGKLIDGNHGMGYECTKCEFIINYEKFQSLINKMMMPKTPKYDPDRIDRTGWE